jgi:hypothetical protein
LPSHNRINTLTHQPIRLAGTQIFTGGSKTKSDPTRLFALRAMNTAAAKVMVLVY